MRFQATPLAGAFVVAMERASDGRGFFARTWCADEFSWQGLNPNLAQCSISYNHVRGTLRGMHFQTAPGEEAKLVRCSRGSIYDVIVDLRPTSATYCRWYGIELASSDDRMLYIPEGFAHGFLTLADGAEVSYHISVPYRKELAAGVRWNDPAFSIQWPFLPLAISEKDKSYPDFRK